MGSALYLDTSVALRATLERGTTPEIEQGLELLTADVRLKDAASAV
ncbi:MAG: hypothetical protein M3461_16270 [Pseudomonadota bacterium]|nr:hypothetical protein [Pseudomonadota bacterium]